MKYIKYQHSTKFKGSLPADSSDFAIQVTALSSVFLCPFVTLRNTFLDHLSLRDAILIFLMAPQSHPMCHLSFTVKP